MNVFHTGVKQVLHQPPQKQKSPRIRRVIHSFLTLSVTFVSLFVTAPAYGDLQKSSPFHGTGQWIWEIHKSGKTPENIARKAQQFGITTVFIKAGDGKKLWPQFGTVVAPLKALGIKTCAWQYVYGRSPTAEAKVAVQVIQQGADCFVIDAEVEFERAGGYKAARTYITKLRKAVGPTFPIGLSSFPYANLHPSFPYSAFFEPPYKADINLPQVYWREIGAKVQTAANTTYLWNDLYGYPIAPIAGVWRGETASELNAFKNLATQHGDPGISYWSWQETRSWQWSALSNQNAQFQTTPLQKIYPSLSLNAKGDSVLWLQIQLSRLGYPVQRSGKFDLITKQALTQFQTNQKLLASGKTDGTTWPTLNALAAKVQVKKTGNTVRIQEPETAGLPAKRYEISPRGARGRPLQ